MVKRLTVAEFLSHAIEMSGKTQREVALEAGYKKPNVLSMMKQGITKVPLDKVPALASACGVDGAQFLRIAMQEYMPESWAVIAATLGDIYSEDEKALVGAYREVRDEHGGAAINVSGETVKAFFEEQVEGSDGE